MLYSVRHGTDPCETPLETAPSYKDSLMTATLGCHLMYALLLLYSANFKIRILCIAKTNTLQKSTASK